MYDGDPNLINADLDRLLEITPQQIKLAVDRYLNTENRAELDIVPAKK
jgi:predicted Zn-dependent peptidase